MVFTQHLTFRAQQLHLRVQRVSTEHILGIQTIQRIHRDVLYLKRRFAAKSVTFKYNSENFKRDIPAADKEEWVYQFRLKRCIL